MARVINNGGQTGNGGNIIIDDAGGNVNVDIGTKPNPEPPVKPTEPPVKPTEPPVKPTEPPVKPTEPPVKPDSIIVKEEEKFKSDLMWLNNNSNTLGNLVNDVGSGFKLKGGAKVFDDNSSLFNFGADYNVIDEDNKKLKVSGNLAIGEEKYAKHKAVTLGTTLETKNDNVTDRFDISASYINSKFEKDGVKATDNYASVHGGVSREWRLHEQENISGDKSSLNTFAGVKGSFNIGQKMAENGSVGGFVGVSFKNENENRTVNHETRAFLESGIRFFDDKNKDYVSASLEHSNTFKVKDNDIQAGFTVGAIKLDDDDVKATAGLNLKFKF